MSGNKLLTTIFCATNAKAFAASMILYYNGLVSLDNSMLFTIKFAFTFQIIILLLSFSKDVKWVAALAVRGIFFTLVFGGLSELFKLYQDFEFRLLTVVFIALVLELVTAKLEKKLAAVTQKESKQQCQ